MEQFLWLSHLFTNGNSPLMKYSILPLFLFALIYYGCSGGSASTVPPVNPAVPMIAFPAPVDTDWVESTLHSLTIEEKAAQVICIWTTGFYQSSDAEQWVRLERLVRERKIGGLVFSLGDVYEYAVQINKLQSISTLPLLIAGDFEYGTGMRVSKASVFPRAMAIGATRNPKYAYAVAKATAEEGRAIGVHQNYAPTIDINNNPKNPVINTRAYGDDLALVRDMGVAFIKGTQDGGMIATAKHFPGHGDTDVDSHLGLTTLNFENDRLHSFELVPFEAAIEAGVQSIMIGHIAVPALDTALGIPATTSRRLTTGLLQNELKYHGLIVTDALEMRGITAKYSPAEAPLLAFEAGADVVLMPVDPEMAVDAIAAAVHRGEIPESRLDLSVRKILTIKHHMGLEKSRLVDINQISTVVASRKNLVLAKQIARDAVTVLGNKNNILPLTRGNNLRVLDIVISDSEDPSAGRNFHNELKERRNNLDLVRLDSHSNKCDYDAAIEKTANADLVICQFHLYVRSGEMTGMMTRDHQELLKRIAALNKPTIGISFGNPYVVMDCPRLDAYVCGYSDADVIQEAVVEVLFGEEAARGKLPISIPGVYKFGDGIQYRKRILREGMPEEVGCNPVALSKVDGIINTAVKDSAFPGAVLLVAKDGVIIHQKAYGTYDYFLASRKIATNSIFDLASVTKVIATTSAVMRLVDEGKIRLTDPVIKYIPAFGQNGKDKITLYNLMVHNSGLQAWRKYYEFCSDPKCVLDSIFAAPREYRTGDSTVYSDLGLITMGKVIEKVTGTTLDKYADSVFFKPLGMKNTMYNPSPKLLDRLVPTEVDSFWKKTYTAVRGRVHDENAATLGGISGHAGLFSTASDLAVILQMLLNGGTYGGERYLNEETIKMFTTRHSETSSRGIGWDTKNARYSFSGKLTSMETFLHTGFTGTSVVVDPARNLVIVFLTNRVNPTRANSKLTKVRPKVHDAILQSLQ
jgi:beta-N-acetylhexosaminidase